MEKRSIGNIRKLENGKWLLRISIGFDDFGKRLQASKTIEASSKKVAEAELMKFYNQRQKILEQKLSSAPDTLGKLYEEFINNHCKLKCQESTTEYYKFLYEHYIEPKASKAKISTFSPKMIYELLHEINGTRTKQGVYVLLKTMFNKAKKWDYLDKNPCDKVDSPKYKSKEKNVYSTSDLNGIISKINLEPLKYQAIFYFAILCGLRRSEIIGLCWDCVDLDKLTFKVVRVATRAKGKSTYLKEETKSRSSNRALQLPTVLVPILKQMRAEQLENKFLLQELWHEGDFIFRQPDGKLMCVDTATAWWNKFLKSNPEFAKINFHSLRHSLATNMLQNGASISDVSAILGHSSKSVTMNVYAHSMADTKTQALIDIENVILNKSV